MTNKNTKMKITELKTQLNKLTHQEVIDLLIESYKISDEVQSYISIRFKGNDSILGILDEYKEKIKNEFFPARGHGKLRVSEVKKAIADFNKISNESELSLELMLLLVETAADFIHEYGDISESMCDYMCDVFEAVIIRINKENISDVYLKYKDRLEAIVNTKGIECWGIHDSLEGSYSILKWVEDDEDDMEETSEIISYAAMSKWLKIPEDIR